MVPLPVILFYFLSHSSLLSLGSLLVLDPSSPRSFHFISILPVLSYLLSLQCKPSYSLPGSLLTQDPAPFAGLSSPFRSFFPLLCLWRLPRLAHPSLNPSGYFLGVCPFCVLLWSHLPQSTATLFTSTHQQIHVAPDTWLASLVWNDWLEAINATKSNAVIRVHGGQ